MWPAIMAWLFVVLATIEGMRASAFLIYGSIHRSRIHKENGASLLVNTAGLTIAAILIFLVL